MVDREVEAHSFRSRLAVLGELELRHLDGALQVQLGSSGCGIAIDGQQSSEASGWTHETGLGNIKLIQLEGYVERSLSGVAGIDGTGLTIELDITAALNIRGKRHWEGSRRCKILHLDT